MYQVATLLSIIACLAGPVMGLSGGERPNSTVTSDRENPAIDIHERGATISTLGGKPVVVSFTNHGLPVTIGSQLVNLLIDTGSDNLVVFEGDCAGCWKGRTRGTFNAIGVAGEETTISYGPQPQGAQSSAPEPNARHYIAPASLPGTPKKKIDYVSVHTYAGRMTVPAPLDGVGGLGLNPKSTWQQFVKKKLFGLKFNRRATPSGRLAGAGQLTLGGYDKSIVSVQKDINWNVVAGRNTWTTAFSGLAFQAVTAERPERIPTNPQHAALFDSGSNLITGPPQDVGALYEGLQAADLISDLVTEHGSEDQIFYKFTCATPKQHFVVSFKFNDIAYDIPRTEFQIPEGDNRCLGVVQPNAQPRGFDWVMGVPFLKTVYTIFDAEKRRIGIYR